MKKELSFSESYTKLEELVAELEEGDIQLDMLTVKVKQAKELIEVCEVKLRTIENEVKEVIKTITTGQKGKNRK